jgi:hypothetical protein
MHWLLYPLVVLEYEGFVVAGPGLDALYNKQISFV